MSKHKSKYALRDEWADANYLAKKHQENQPPPTPNNSKQAAALSWVQGGKK